MKNLLKKNQLMITALAIMLGVAGYLQFAGTNLNEEEYLPTSGNPEVLENVDAENLTAEDANSEYDLTGLLDLSETDLSDTALTDIESLDSDVDGLAENYLDGSMDIVAEGEGLVAEGETPPEGEIPGEAVFTSNAGVATLSEAKMLKEQVRAKNKETLSEIINSTGLTDAQKQTAVEMMVQMTSIADKEMAAEILLQAKGFSDVVVSIDGNTVDVVVNVLELTDTQRAQIEDIVKRKTEVEAANIIISTVVQ